MGACISTEVKIAPEIEADRPLTLTSQEDYHRYISRNSWAKAAMIELVEDVVGRRLTSRELGQMSVHVTKQGDREWSGRLWNGVCRQVAAEFAEQIPPSRRVTL